jgi:hypothetical protein
LSAACLGHRQKHGIGERCTDPSWIEPIVPLKLNYFNHLNRITNPANQCLLNHVMAGAVAFGNSDPCQIVKQPLHNSLVTVPRLRGGTGQTALLVFH